MKRFLLLSALVLVISAIKAQDNQIKVFCDKSQSTITYSMHHLLHSWEGVSNEVNSVILSNEDRTEISQVAVSVRISSFDSQNANRDSHAMEATEALFFPSISFTSNTIKAVDAKLEVKGSITFHGISQEISFIADKELVDKKVKITGDFIVKLSQFDIKPPTLLGIATDDEIAVSFSVIY